MTEIEDVANSITDSIAVLDATGKVYAVARWPAQQEPIQTKAWLELMSNSTLTALGIEDRISTLVRGEQSEFSIVYEAAGQYFALIGIRLPFECRTPILLRHVSLGPERSANFDASQEARSFITSNGKSTISQTQRAEAPQLIFILEPLFNALDSLRSASERAERSTALAPHLDAFEEVILQTARLIDHVARDIKNT